MSDTPDALTIDRLNVRYGVLHGVQDLSLRVPVGQVVALVGANGADKSSTLNAIAGVISSSAAAVHAHGKDIARLSPRDRIIEHGVVLVPEVRSVFTTMTVRENLELGGRVGARRIARSKTTLPRFGLSDVAALFPVLKERANRRAEYLSGGERQMLAMARALLMAPSVLLVDEPSMRLAPLAIRDLFGILRDVFVQGGVAVLLVEQDTRLALDLAGVAYLLQRGSIVASGSAEEPARRSARAVRVGDSWADVPHVPGSYVVNIGDLMARWTNDRWVSTVHREVNPGAADVGRDRLSIPFFHQPNYDAVIACLSSCASEDRPPRYAPVTSGEWVQRQTRRQVGVE